MDKAWFKTSAMNEAIVKINSKPLEPLELKRLDKLEKEGFVSAGLVVKGRTFILLTTLQTISKLLREQLSF